MTTRIRGILIALAIIALLAAGLAYEIAATRPVRESTRAFSELIAIGNRPARTETERLQSLAAARELCSSRYLAAKPLELGPEGGIVGLPRTMQNNFMSWREAQGVWICPRKRLGPVYQFVLENGCWRFDGLVAMFVPPRGELVRVEDMPDLDL
jgi:hypothetical protein